MTNEEIVAYIIDTYEGPIFTEDPVDTGGATKYGITKRTLEHYWRTVSGLGDMIEISVEQVKQLSREEAIRVGVAVFVVESGLAAIADWRLRFAAVDYAFHSGWVPAIRALQKACGGLVVDGVFGPHSQASVNAHPNSALLGLRLVTHRAKLMQAIIEREPTQKKWAFGWWRRLTKVQDVLGE